MKKIKYIYNDARYKKWRDSIYKRDHYQCQLCGQKGGQLNAHHILRKADYPDLAYNKNNGITLCVKCHEAVTGNEEGIAPLFKSIIRKTLTLAKIKKVFNILRKNNKQLYQYIKNKKEEITTQLARAIKKQRVDIWQGKRTQIKKRI